MQAETVLLQTQAVAVVAVLVESEAMRRATQAQMVAHRKTTTSQAALLRTVVAVAVAAHRQVHR
jgi:hypothetical protein